MVAKKNQNSPWVHNKHQYSSTVYIHACITSVALPTQSDSLSRSAAIISYMLFIALFNAGHDNRNQTHCQPHSDVEQSSMPNCTGCTCHNGHSNIYTYGPQFLATQHGSNTICQYSMVQDSECREHVIYNTRHSFPGYSLASNFFHEMVSTQPSS